MSSSDELSPQQSPESAVQGLTRAEAFTLRINDIVKSSFINLGLGLGHELGLFKALCEINKPATSNDIADVAGCKERYVREWLYMMTAADIVEMNDSGEELFFLPETNRQGVTCPEEGSLIALAPTTSILAYSFGPLLECFKKDGPPGVGAEYGQPFLTHWESHRDMSNMAEEILSQIPGLEQQLEEGIHCLDLGGGRGNMVIHLASKFPRSTFWNCDLNTVAAETGAAEAKKLALKNVVFHTGDACNLPESWTEKFSFVLMIDFLHDVPFPDRASSETLRVLKPGGHLSVVDIEVDGNSRVTAKEQREVAVYTFSLFYCLSQSLAVQGSAGLGTAPGVKKLTSILIEAGFPDVQHLTLTQNCHLVCKKSE